VHTVVDFRVLGPLRVCVRGTEVPIHAAKQRALAAALILHANKTVVLDELSDVLWDEQPPRDVRGAIQAYVMRLRQALGHAAGQPLIRTVPGGYLLEADDEAVDLLRFYRLTRQAERAATAGALRDASCCLEDALALWRGAPLVDVDSDSLHRSEIPMLREQRLLAEERRLEIELALGHHRDVIAQLNVLVAAHPLRERYWQMLMLALHQSGWRADALAAYRRARQMFSEELGIEPGEELRGLHEAVLTERPLAERGFTERLQPERAQPATGPGRHLRPVPPPPETQPPGGRAVTPESTWIGQCQLPREVEGFTGRNRATDEIAAALAGNGRSARIMVVSGEAGAGKSALAVRVAHRVRRHFPDGQLYLRLGETASSRERLAGLIADLMLATGRSRESIPDGLDQRAAVLRAWLADRRVLLVIDDVTEAAQVLPLLPGTRGCAVLITSRNDLRALTVLHGARHYVVGALEPPEAAGLLRGMLGSRVAVEPAATAELAALCRYLPLALRTAAATLASTPGVRLEHYVAMLRHHVRLARRDQAGTPVPRGRGGTLDPGVARLLDLVSIPGGQEFTVSDVAALLSTETPRAARLLQQASGAARLPIAVQRIGGPL
jgi:DNA-binding SARP family transcriptional activator